VSFASLPPLPPTSTTGKYHVEQDPQFALVHLQFVHWADKLLKVLLPLLLVMMLLMLIILTVRFRTPGTARLSA
jgi:hypothetical protein